MNLSRRDFLIASGATLLAVSLVGCTDSMLAPPSTETPSHSQSQALFGTGSESHDLYHSSGDTVVRWSGDRGQSLTMTFGSTGTVTVATPFDRSYEYSLDDIARGHADDVIRARFGDVTLNAVKQAARWS